MNGRSVNRTLCDFIRNSKPTHGNHSATVIYCICVAHWALNEVAWIECNINIGSTYEIIFDPRNKGVCFLLFQFIYTAMHIAHNPLYIKFAAYIVGKKNTSGTFTLH